MLARPAWRGNRPGARVGARTDRDACRRLRRRRRIAAFRKPTRPWPRSPVLPPAAFEGSGVGDSQRARQIDRRGRPSRPAASAQYSAAGPASSPSASRPASGGAAKGRSCLIRKREASGHDVLMQEDVRRPLPVAASNLICVGTVAMVPPCRRHMHSFSYRMEKECYRGGISG